MSMGEQKIIIGVVAVLIIGAIAVFAFAPKGVPNNGTTVTAGKYAELAQCLTDSGAKFYGVFWCQHCTAQKALFGDAAKNIPYVECSTADGKGQLKICKDAGVASYPTWIFADQSKLNGNIPLATLATKTGCTLPTL